MSGTAIRILLALHKGPMAFRPNRPTIDLTDAEIARRAGGCSIATVQRGLKELVKQGWIGKRGRGHRYLTRLYLLAGGTARPMSKSEQSTFRFRPTPEPPPIRIQKEPTSSSEAKRDDDDAAPPVLEESKGAEVTTVAEPLTVETTVPELPAGALEAIALAEAEPELGPSVADAIRADAARMDRELAGRWDWFIKGLCVVVVSNLAAERGRRSRIGDAVSYAMGAAVRNPINSYRANGCPDQKARDAEAKVRRRIADRAGLVAAPPRAAPKPEPKPPSDEDLKELRERAAGRQGKHHVAFSVSALVMAGDVCHWPRKEGS